MRNERDEGLGNVCERQMFLKAEKKNAFEGDCGAGDRIEGRNPVLEALRSGRAINKILFAGGGREGSIRQIAAIAKERTRALWRLRRQRNTLMLTTY